MCGICGYVTKDNINEDTSIYNMACKLTDRGPDSLGIYINGGVALGHTRLSIRDIQKGSQPFSRVIAGNKYTIVYNGEIYNSKELREDLEKKGYTFFSTSDTEIVLLCYIEYGNESVKLLNGIFAYAILDETKDTIFLARDRLGIKPLFYYNKENFVFASEIKSILEYPIVTPCIKKDELCEIFGLGPAHTPGKTFFNGIYELLPGYFGIWSKNGLESFKYWDLETKQITDSINDSIIKTKELVEDALKKQLISDVPICSMLSGGLDSSVLSYLASKEIKDLPTFSIDFENNNINFNGTDYQPTRDSDFVEIMKNYMGSNHTNLFFSTDEIFSNLKASMIARDMPGMADVDSSMLVFCKKIKECGYKVAISGECSDEIFGGYPWYYKEHLIDSINFPWSKSIDARKNIISKDLVDPNYLENYIQNAYDKTCQNVVYDSDDEMENTFRRTCYTTIKWFMNTLVERTDRMSMASGLEVRVPFADHRIFEYIYNVSCKSKLGLINGNEIPIEKYILRKAFENDLPDEIVYRKKSPFPKTYDPKYTYLLEKQVEDIIRDSTSPLLEIVNVNYLFEILETHGENLKENWFGQLMTYPQTLAYLIQVNMWLKEYNVKINV